MKRKAGGIVLYLSKAILFMAPPLILFFGQVYFYEEAVLFFWGNVLLALIFASVLYMAVKIFNGFDFGNRRLSEIIIAWIIGLFIANTLQYFIMSLLNEALLPVRGVATMFIAEALLAIPLSLLTRSVYYVANPAQRVLIIFGDNLEKLRLYKTMISKQPETFKIADTIYHHEQTGMLLDAIGRVEAVFFLDVDDNVQEVLLEYCYLNDKRTYVLPTFSRVLFNTAGTIWLSNSPVFSLKKQEPGAETLIIKRLIDLFISTLAIIVSSPIMLIIMLAVRAHDGHPAIYKQVRVTKNGRKFNIYKFRSMIFDAEDDGIPRLTTKDDKRVTPIGRVIRRTRLDELPQLFNVLFGAMSIVGPRPERPEIAQKYEEIYPNFAFRTKVKAGITGYAQVFGRYNTAPEEKLFLDIMYIETFSVWQDIKLMLQTINVLFNLSSSEGIDDETSK